VKLVNHQIQKAMQKVMYYRFISFPCRNIPSGTIEEAQWFTEMLEIDCQKLTPEIRSYWFDEVLLPKEINPQSKR
jgi:hypothetical protein